MPAALAINIAVWAFILIACVVLGIRAYNKRQVRKISKSGIIKSPRNYQLLRQELAICAKLQEVWTRRQRRNVHLRVF